MTQSQRKLLTELVPQDWDSGKPAVNSGFNRVRYLQNVDDLVSRPQINRSQAASGAVVVHTNGNAQSTGVAAPQALQPKRYAEFTVKARVTYNINSVGPAFVFAYRTLGPVPANGAAPNAGDVIVGGDAFTGGPTTSGVNQSASFSFLDTGLDVTKRYSYYLAVEGPNGNVFNLAANSQLLVMERS